MPGKSQASIKTELDIIEKLISIHPEGVSRPDLEAEFSVTQGRTIPWRTLLRRLATLADHGRIRVKGKARSAVYQPTAEPAAQPSALDAGEIPLTEAAVQLRALVRQPMAKRTPVGYNAGFLEAYAPGKTAYVPQALRKQLYNMGGTPDADLPAGTYAREILGRLLIDLSWASSRLEGNTYSRLDTQNLIEFGQRAAGKDATETTMILNHKTAIEILVEAAEEIDFNRYTLFSLHAALSENLLGDPADEGRLRTRIVGITGTTFTPLSIPQKIEEYFDLFLNKARAIPDPFEQAFFAMVHIPYLQPFSDVNKRTSRLAANIPLIKANLCPLSFIDVPQQVYVDGTVAVYEDNRVELLRDVFVWAYARSCTQYRVIRDSMGEPDPFRLRYRQELATAVRETVQTGSPPARRQLEDRARNLGVPEGDVDQFVTSALTLLVALSENNAGRYQIRPSEFTKWKSNLAPDGG
jgi:Fic family protein